MYRNNVTGNPELRAQVKHKVEGIEKSVRKCVGCIAQNNTHPQSSVSPDENLPKLLEFLGKEILIKLIQGFLLQFLQRFLQNMLLKFLLKYLQRFLLIFFSAGKSSFRDYSEVPPEGSTMIPPGISSENHSERLLQEFILELLQTTL